MTAPLTISPDAPARQSSEIRAKRRTFSAAETLCILREAERCPQGELSALLRREGIYSSHLTAWPRERERGQLAGLAPRKRERGQLAGLAPRKRVPKVDELAQQLAELQRGNARLTAKLRKAELIIDGQKSYCRCSAYRSRGRLRRTSPSDANRADLGFGNRRPGCLPGAGGAAQ